jgi:hypothetical protein
MPAHSGWTGSKTPQECSGHAADGRLAQQVGQLLELAGHAVDDDGRPQRSAHFRHRPRPFEQVHPQRDEHRTDWRLRRVDECPSQHRPELAERSDLVAPLHRRRRELDERTGEERVGGEVALVLLTRSDDEGCTVRPRVGEVAHGVAEPGGGVEVDECGPARRLRVAVGHADDRRLLQRKYVVDVVDPGQRVDEGELGRPWVAEDVTHALGPQHLEQDIAPRHLVGHRP